MHWYILVGTVTNKAYTAIHRCKHIMYSLNTHIGRHLGLVGDHTVSTLAVLYRYSGCTQVLRRPDLVNSKVKPVVTNARLRVEAVWKFLEKVLHPWGGGRGGRAGSRSRPQPDSDWAVRLGQPEGWNMISGGGPLRGEQEGRLRVIASCKSIPNIKIQRSR